MGDERQSKSARDTAVVDWAVAAQNIPGAADGVATLARLMAAECPPMLADLRAAVEEGDAKRAGIAAHKLQGAAR